MPNKPDIESLAQKRVQQAEDSYTSLQRIVRTLQRVAYDAVLDWFDDTIQQDDAGKIRFSAGNLSKVQGVFGVIKKFGQSFRAKVLGEILNETQSIVEANAGYFENFMDVPDIREAARLETLLRWGYNARTGEILAGGYMENIFQSAEVGQRVASLVNDAISRKVGLKEFRGIFRGVFIGKPGAGMIESRFNQVTYDLYQRFDRTANLIYANRLKLDNAVYSGTLIQTSRPFCIARIGQVFNRQQIEGWKEIDFAGKPLIYDPFVDCGGHNCRHHLSWITDEMAQILKPK